jgi:hypothetical protein
VTTLSGCVAAVRAMQALADRPKPGVTPLQDWLAR